MRNVVFILGAGASKPGGCPTMANFFSLAEGMDLNNAWDDLGLVDDFELVQRIRKELYNHSVKAAPDIDNLESVFLAIEMAEDLGRLGRLSQPQLLRAKSSFIRFVMGVLSHSQLFRTKDWATATGPDRTAYSPVGYDLLTELILALVKCGWRCHVISFNYDLGLEFSLAGREIQFSGLTPNVDSPVHLYKLHGAFNWFESADGVLTEDVEGLQDPRPWMVETKRQRNFSTLALTNWLNERHPNQLPLIVPPGDAKASFRAKVRRLWALAGSAVGSADAIVQIGYSIPSADRFFRDFYLVANMTSHVLRRWYVVDPCEDVSEEVRKLVGPVMQNCVVGRADLPSMGDFGSAVTLLAELLRTPKHPGALWMLE